MSDAWTQESRVGSPRHRCSETAGVWERNSPGEDRESQTEAKCNNNYNVAFNPVCFFPISRLRWRIISNASSSEKFKTSRQKGEAIFFTLTWTTEFQHE